MPCFTKHERKVRFLDRLGFLILSVLMKNRAASGVSAMSVREMMQEENFDWKENTIFKRIKSLEKSGSVGRGLKEGRAATYYITPEGCKFLEKM